jgi:hypothetical protein
MRFLILVPLLLVGCPGSSSAPCDASPCPAGAFDQCELGAVPASCCLGGKLHAACAVDAGLLTNVCPGCDGGVCAVSGDSGVTCQVFGR